MCVGSLVEVINEASYYSSNMQNASSRTTSRLYRPLPKRKSLDDDTYSTKSSNTTMMSKTGPRTGSLADRMQRARYNTLAKYSRSA